MQAPPTHLVPKISLIFWGSFDPVSDIKLIRTEQKMFILRQFFLEYNKGHRRQEKYEIIFAQAYQYTI